MEPSFIVPGFPLYILGALLFVVYVYRYFLSRKSPSPTNYTYLGKAFSWLVLSGLYFWASVTNDNVIVVRNFVRLGVLLHMVTFTAFAVLEIWLEHRYK